MNKRQRNNNRNTYVWMLREVQPICERCGKKGIHKIFLPMTLEQVLLGKEQSFVWVCKEKNVVENA